MFLLDNVSTFCSETAPIWYIVGVVINIFKIIIPIVIVLLAILDLGKAVMAGDDKEIKEAQKMLIKRIIYGVVIFFVVTVVQAIFSLVSQNFIDNKDQACWACATQPNGSICKNARNNENSDLPNS